MPRTEFVGGYLVSFIGRMDVYWCIDGWMDGWMNVMLSGWLYGWMNVCKVEWLGVWMVSEIVIRVWVSNGKWEYTYLRQTQLTQVIAKPQVKLWWQRLHKAFVYTLVGFGYRTIFFKVPRGPDKGLDHRAINPSGVSICSTIFRYNLLDFGVLSGVLM